MTIIPFFEDLAYTMKGIFLYEFFLKKSAYWSRDQMNKFQFFKLKKLLIESNDGVPYYKELFKELSFDPRTDFNSLDDFKKLPILDKTFVKKNNDIFFFFPVRVHLFISIFLIRLS
jgi:phenylacetate-coenzyme A ligase PaaK-like adenylate-forming protein